MASSDASDRDPMTSILIRFYNACDVASSDASNRDLTSLLNSKDSHPRVS